jgi:phospholipid/cholesterol/gamma-HCH transport system permease protein
MFNAAQQIGKVTTDTVADLGRFSRFTAGTISWAFAGLGQWRNWQLIFPQFWEVGVRSLPVVLLTGTFVGMVLAVQAYAQFFNMGLANRLGSIINISVVRELGPVLAGVMLAGRVGGSLTAELGTMKVTEQIEALRSMGADPLRVLVAPRFLACLLMIPFLTIYTDLTGVFGGYFICVDVYGVNAADYWRYSALITETWDISAGLLKSFFFGGAIGLISCYKGFRCSRGASGVGRACTEGFVLNFIVILALDFFLAILLSAIYECIWGRISLV